MVPESFHEFLGFDEAPEAAYDRGEMQHVHLNFDLSPFFEQDPNEKMTRGEMFLNRFGLPLDTTVNDLMEVIPSLKKAWHSQDASDTREELGLAGSGKISTLIDVYLDRTTKEDYLF